MNFKFVVLLALVCSSFCVEKKNENEEKRELATLALSTLAAVLAPIAVGGIQSLASFLHGVIFSDYKDTVMFNRMVRVKQCGENNCIEITDKQTGLVGRGTGSSSQEALGDATQQLFEELLEKGHLSLFDLCELHITFPHPNKDQCPGVEINPCDLIHPVITTPTPCVDKLIGSYCTTNMNRCGVALYQTFMLENCFKTCTNGKCKLPGSNNDPCAISFK